MKRVLIDSKNDIIYEGAEAKELLKLLKAEPEDVSEEDEVKWEKELRELNWCGNLRFEAHFDLKFKGIDDWYRPVFKDVDADLYFGSTNKLFSWAEWQKDGLAYFKEHPNMLEYFGTKFNCEPNGGTNEYWKFNILE